MMEPTEHARLQHHDAERHHGHTHAAHSRHTDHHHLLQVEDLCVSFRRYSNPPVISSEGGEAPNPPVVSSKAGESPSSRVVSSKAGEACNPHVISSKTSEAPNFPVVSSKAGESPNTHVVSSKTSEACNPHVISSGGGEAAGVEKSPPNPRKLPGSSLWASQHDVDVLRHLNVAVHAGEVVAVVGASGAGKSLLADCVLGLFDAHATVTGRIWFDGEEQTAESLARLRGRSIALVPQSIAGLDPLMKVGRQVQGAGPRSTRAQRAALQRELFARYGLAPEVANLYPFQLSGGMARRVLLCCALMGDPQLIVADEPTVGLDRDLALSALADFRAFADEGGSVMLITHDIELALQVADRVAVFRDGTVVEETAAANFAAPDLLETPYARALWHALPEHDFRAPRDEKYASR